eukprot:2123271-Pleurochrysis_carterae.AAC.1
MLKPFRRLPSIINTASGTFASLLMFSSPFVPCTHSRSPPSARPSPSSTKPCPSCDHRTPPFLWCPLPPRTPPALGQTHTPAETQHL